MLLALSLGGATRAHSALCLKMRERARVAYIHTHKVFLRMCTGVVLNLWPVSSAQVAEVLANCLHRLLAVRSTSTMPRSAINCNVILAANQLSQPLLLCDPVNRYTSQLARANV